ncbi:MAG: response regulator transcription factor [Clostridia bacterium]|nr:response regulator transcription factor [Clostridia bacterium]MBR2053450.1 response regulator transcription factor [Clostridia bacterium]MBR6753187.1 response regulator transcription factor [Clostridia bacterium]
MPQQQKILVVDDDPNIAQLIRLYLEKEGYQVAVESRGDSAIAAFRKDPPHLIILDIMLPGMDGWQVCRTIRQLGNVPIIMLSAKDETFDKVLGLELGADDYITKPFEGKELAARVKAVLRRSAQDTPLSDTITYPGLSISLEKYEVVFRDKAVEMPPKELEVLYFLAAHKNRVFTREQLLEQVWGFDFFGDSRTVDVHIKRLREKLQDTESLGWQIRTVWGVGYKFEVK